MQQCDGVSLSMGISSSYVSFIMHDDPGQAWWNRALRISISELCILWQLGKLSRRLNFLFSTTHQSHCGSYICLDHLLLVCAAVAEGKGRWLRLPFRTVKPHSLRQGGTVPLKKQIGRDHATAPDASHVARVATRALCLPRIVLPKRASSSSSRGKFATRREPLVCIWRSPVTQAHLRRG